jgi:ribonuclease HI
MTKPNVIIYTDGGCAPNPGAGGWGVVLLSADQPGNKKELFGGVPDSTNNRMELTAAIKALQALKKPCNVEFHTDSQYVQKAFTQKWLVNWQKNNWRTSQKKPVANKDLWIELVEAAQPHEINWNWVKGHDGDINNERCDELVWQGRETLK